MLHADLTASYLALQADAGRLAGNLTDLSQRATVYHHLFLASGGNHCFPLIAAHGALWAGGHFRAGIRLAGWLSWQFALRPSLRRKRLQQLDEFADAFRDVNRRVCIDTYTNFHFTARFGEHSGAAELVSPELLSELNRLHAAIRQGRAFSDDERRRLFEAHFLHEQQHVVGPALEAAVAKFDWPIVKSLALRPRVTFAYFPEGSELRFSNFANRQERIEKGMAAFELGRQVGWKSVDAALQRYAVLPVEFFADPVEHFANLRATVLQTLPATCPAS